MDNARRYFERALEISERVGLLTEPERLRQELAQLHMS
jgi:hypothetical protein